MSPSRWRLLAPLLLAALAAGCATRPPAQSQDQPPSASAHDATGAAPPSPRAPATASDTTAGTPPVTPRPAGPADAVVAAQPVPAREGVIAVAADPAPASMSTAAPLDNGRAVFATLRGRLASDACSDDRVAMRWIAHYARAPDRLAANLEAVLPLLAWVLEQIVDADLPGEFALLPVVESWYRPDARNGGGPAGLWQFSAITARDHGLRIEGRLDERLAPAAATSAALAYLAGLQARFGDWRLATMAFNAGEFRLARALRAAPGAPSPQDHLPPGLSTITYEHLGRLLALACLVREPDRIGLALPEAAFEPLRRLPGPSRRTTLAQVARALDVDPARLALLNPGYSRAGPIDGTRIALLVPGGHARWDPSTLARLAIAPEPSDATVRHQVRRGDSLWAIARRYGVALADLRRWNALAGDAVLQPGQWLRLRP